MSTSPDPRAWKVRSTHYIDRDPANRYKVRDWTRESESAPWKSPVSRAATQSDLQALIPRYRGAA